MIERANVLITGGSGFLGSSLVKQLQLVDKYSLTIASRSALKITGGTSKSVGEYDSLTDWADALSGQHYVVHTAALNNDMKENATNPIDKYRRVNMSATLNLARQAATSGVKRFIFISSIKVNGERTDFGKVFTADDLPNPKDAYGISKWEAEQGLTKLAVKTGMEVVIIRPPLVYGPGVKGNFSKMTKLVAKGLPLPFGAIYNKRSLVAVDNLVDLIITCIEHPAAANQIFLVGDGVDLSTTELFRNVAYAMGKPSLLLPVPSSLLILVAKFLGKTAVAQSFLGSLQVDNSKAFELLGWEPPISVEEGLRRCFEED